jgi:hypothetical protein
VAVRGKTAGVQLYEVVDAEAPERRVVKLETRARLRSAMEGYFGGDFKAARSAFEQISFEAPDDAVPALFAERCTRYLQEPPPEDWNGFERLN